MVHAVDNVGSSYNPSLEPQIHEVGTYDTLESIAVQFGVSPAAIRLANPEIYPRHVQLPGEQTRTFGPGVRLTIPAAADSVFQEPLDGTYSPVGAQQGTTYSYETDQGEVNWNPSQGSVGATVSTSVTAEVGSTPGGAKPASLSASIQANTSANYAVSNEDGNTVVTVSNGLSVASEISAELQGRHPLLQASVTDGSEHGVESSFQVILPGENQPPEAIAGINPFDPTTIPVGAKVVISADSFSEQYSEVVLAHIGAQTGSKEWSGSSFSIERPSADSVRVTLGPHEALSRSGGLGVVFDNFKAMVGRSDTFGEARLKTATFDITDANAQAAFDHFAQTGEIDGHTSGVSDIATIQRTDSLSQSKTALKLYGIGVDIAGLPSSRSSIAITYPDGSATVVEEIDDTTNVPLEITSRYDAEGREIISERRYRFDLGELSVHEADALFMAMGQSSYAGWAKAGHAQVEFTQDEMQALYQQAKIAAKAHDDHSPSYKELTPGMVNGAAYDNSSDDAYVFATTLATSGALQGGADGSYQFAEQMRLIASGADGDVNGRGGWEWLDGTVQIT